MRAHRRSSVALMALFGKKRAKEAVKRAPSRPLPGGESASAAPESLVRPLGDGGERVASRVLVRPHITEKAGRAATMNQYVFVVSEGATKPMIARAVFEIYGVRPIRVHTVRIAGKRRRIGRIEGRAAGYRKAIVTLPEGKTIEVLPK